MLTDLFCSDNIICSFVTKFTNIQCQINLDKTKVKVHLLILLDLHLSNYEKYNFT